MCNLEKWYRCTYLKSRNRLRCTDKYMVTMVGLGGMNWKNGIDIYTFNSVQFSSVHSLSRVWLFVTPWIAAHQASLSITSSRSSLKLSPSSRWCHPAISSSVVPFSSSPQSLRASGSFTMTQLFAWGGQSIGVSALASVLPMNTQDWSTLGWTHWTSLQSKGLSRVFSTTTVQKHQFFGAQLSSQFNSHIHTWLLEKPQPWLDWPCWQSNISAF